MEKVLIRKPCLQNLEYMPRVNGGLICTVCNSKVHDLTKLSDEELVEWLKENQQQRPCGTYRDDQAKVPFYQRMIAPFRYATLSLAAMGISRKAHADANQCIPTDSFSHVISSDDSSHRIITGQVVSRPKGIPISDVTVCVTGADSIIGFFHTKEDGSFVCNLPATTDKSYTLTFYLKGYESEVVYSYVPCDKSLVVSMKMKSRHDRRKENKRRVRSKF